MAKGPNKFVPSGKLKALELREGSGIGVSNLLSGRIRYNETLNRFEHSENGGTYYTLDPNVGLLGTSANATPVELTTDGLVPGITNRFFIQLGHGYCFRIAGTCMCVSGPLVGKFFSVEIKAAIKNIGGTVTIVGTTTYDKTCVDPEMTEVSLLVLADNVNKSLSLIGIAIAGGNAYNWVVSLHTVDNV